MNINKQEIICVLERALQELKSDDYERKYEALCHDVKIIEEAIIDIRLCLYRIVKDYGQTPVIDVLGDKFPHRLTAHDALIDINKLTTQLIGALYKKE